MNHPLDEKKIYLFLGVLLSVCSIVPVWMAEYFPSQNGPAFLNIMHMFKEMNNPEFSYSEYFMRHLHYMPYLSFYVLVFSLSFLFPLLTAQKIVLSFIVMAFPLSVFYYLKRIDPKKILFGFPVYLMVYNFLFMRSYNNFMIAVALFFIFLGYWHSVKNNLNWKRLCILNIFLVLIYASHIIVLFFLVLVLILIQFFESRSFLDIVKHLLKFSIPTLISCAHFIYFSASNSIWHEERMILFNWVDKTQDIYDRFLWPYSHTGKILAFIPFLIVLFSIIRKKGDIFSRFITKDKLSIYNSTENRHLFLVFVTALIYYLAPWEIIGWHKADIRFIPFLFIFILAGGQPFKSERHRITFVLGTSVLALILFIQIGQQVRYLDGVIKNEYLSGMNHIKKNKTLLPLYVSKPEFRFVNPYAHVHNYYGIFRGSITGKSLAAYNTVSPVWYRDYREFPNFSRFPIFKVSNLDRESIGIIRDAYDYVLIWGNDKEVENKFMDNGFRLVFEQKRLHIFEPG